MQYRWVSLRSVYEADMPWLFGLLCDPGRNQLWFRDRSVFDQSQFEAVWRLWMNRDISAKFIILANDQPVGLCFDTHRTLEDGHSEVTVLLESSATGRGTGVFATALFADWLFRTLPLRRLKFEVLEFNFQVLNILRKLHIHRYAVIPEDRLHNGRYWSRECFAISREEWPALKQQILRAG